jgi:protein-disulfide isomerase
MRRCAAALFALSLCLATAPKFDPGKAVGSMSAPVVLEVFSSFDCPHCKDFHDEVEPQLVKDYVNSGKVAIVNREFPLTGPYHPYARDAAIYATAAARIGKYPEVADTLWKNQAIWAANGKVWETVASVLTLAEQKKVQALAKDPGVLAEVQQDVDDGTKGGINSTPTIFVDAKGKHMGLPSGVPNYYFLSETINGLLK